MSAHFRRYSGLILLAFSLAMLAWSALPPKMQSAQLLFSTSDLQRLMGQFGPQQPFVEMPAYRLLLNWPEKIRVGEIQEIYLVFQPETEPALSGQPVEKSALGVDQGDAVSTSPSLTIVGRLESPNLLYLPAGQIGQKLTPGQPVAFGWRVQPAQAQTYQATVWVYLGITESGQEPSFRQVLAAQEVSVKGIKFLGLDSLAARLIGSLGAAVGAVLSLDKIVVDLILIIRRKWKPQA